jgi:hypothetical protein
VIGACCKRDSGLPSAEVDSGQTIAHLATIVAAIVQAAEA